MDKFNLQEQSSSIQKLKKLLNSFELRQKREDEWIVMENELFFKLDAEEDSSTNTGHTKHSPISFSPIPVLLRPVFLTAVLIIAVISGIIINLNVNFTPGALAGSRILSISGDVSVTYEKEIEKSKDSKPSLLLTSIYNGQVFKTGNKASLIVQLDQGTAFKLNSNTKLTVINADRNRLVFHLDNGSIISTVSKRLKNQQFAVTTPNARCKVVGTVFSVSIKQDSDGNHLTDLTVFEGNVEITYKENRAIGTTVQTGRHISLFNKTLNKSETISENQDAIRDISLLKLSLEMANDSITSYGLAEFVSNPPGAKIIINSQIVGKTPMIVKYPSGMQEVCISSPGFKKWKDEVNIQKNQSVSVTAYLVGKDNNIKSKTSISDLKTFKTDTCADGSYEENYVNKPEYIEALIQITVGEYHKALALLDSLKNRPDISTNDRKHIMKKIALCYRGLGDFERALKNLTGKYRSTKDINQRGSILWEIATVRINCLEDYNGAIKDLNRYIRSFPNGAWIEAAYLKLGESYCMIGQMDNAVKTYRIYIERFPKGFEIDKVIYYLANILKQDINNYNEALRWYNKILEDYHHSMHSENAMFELAECYSLLGLHRQARSTFQKYMQRYPDGLWSSICSDRLSTHY